MDTERLKAELHRCESSQGTGHDVAKMNQLRNEIDKRKNNVSSAQYEELIDALSYAADSLASAATDSERDREMARVRKHLAALIGVHCNRAGDRLDTRARGAVRRANGLIIESH